MEYFALSDIGKYRELNEDSYLANGKIFAVADGLGGHAAGEVASSIALKVIEDRMNKTFKDRKEIEQEMLETIKEANRIVFKKAFQKPELHGMGTTLTIAVPFKNELLIGHVGDSRAYLLRDGNLKRLTEDHTLVFQMIKEGKLKEEEAEFHPLRSTLTRALGTNEFINIDFISLTLKPNDLILLCTDGLSSMISDSQIAQIFQEESDLKKMAEKLVKLANERGGIDNITVVLIKMS